MKEVKKVSKRMEKVMQEWREENPGYKITGLKGPKTVGKSTFAANKYQLKDEYFIIALAKPIKDIVHGVVETKDIASSQKVYEPYLTGDNLEDMNRLMRFLLSEVEAGIATLAVKESLRAFYQSVGDIMRAQDPDIYIKILLDTVASQDIKDIIVDDVRQYNEGFLCDELVLLSREGVEYTNEHISEMDYTSDEYQELALAGVHLVFTKLETI